MSKEKEETKKKVSTTKTKVAEVKENDKKKVDSDKILKQIANLVEAEGNPPVFELTGTEDSPINVDELTEPGIYFLRGKTTVQIEGLREEEYNYGCGDFVFFVLQYSLPEGEENYPVYQIILWIENINPLVATRYGFHYADQGETSIGGPFASVFRLRNGNYKTPIMGGYISSQELSNAFRELITQIVPYGSVEEIPLSTLNDLQTSDKSSLVNAINEVNHKVNNVNNNGGEITPTNSLYKELTGTEENPINIDDVIESGMYILNGTITCTWDEQILDQLHENSQNYMFVSSYYDETINSEMITQNLLYWNKQESCLGVLSRNCSLVDYEAGRLSKWINKNLALIPKDYIDMEEGIVSNTDLRGMTSQLITEMYIDKNNNQYSVPVSTLKDLQTNDKSSLVNALNEINQKINNINGGGSYIPDSDAFQCLTGVPGNPVYLDDIVNPGVYVIKGESVPIIHPQPPMVNSFTYLLFVSEEIDSYNNRIVSQTFMYINENVPIINSRIKTFSPDGIGSDFSYLPGPIRLQLGNYTIASQGIIDSNELHNALSQLVTTFTSESFGEEIPLSKLENLNTVNKRSLVEAINEVNDKINAMSGGVLPTSSYYNELIGTEESPINLNTVTEPGMYVIRGKITSSEYVTGDDISSDMVFLSVIEQVKSDNSKVIYQTMLSINENIPSINTRSLSYSPEGQLENSTSFFVPIQLEYPSSLQQTNKLVSCNSLFYIVNDFITQFTGHGPDAYQPISKLVNLDTENKESLVNAINELKGEIDTLKAEIETLKSGE